MSDLPASPWAVILLRSVVTVSGPDTVKFLQGLISNDSAKVSPASPIYAFLLSAQGKYLFDFILHAMEGGVAIDVDADSADALAGKLSQYKLRSKVSIALRPDQCVAALSSGGALDSRIDPRLAALGHRILLARDGAERFLTGAGYTLRDNAAYDAHRLTLGVPDHHEFVREQSFLLECNGEELRGVDFRKGCYVGQELTARMKHRGSARRRILRVVGPGLARGSAIMDGDRTIGEILGVQGDAGLASIRLDRWREAGSRPLTANGARVDVSLPAYPLNLPPEDSIP